MRKHSWTYLARLGVHWCDTEHFVDYIVRCVVRCKLKVIHVPTSMHVMSACHLVISALQGTCGLHTVASVTSDSPFAVVDDLQHLLCLLDSSVGTWVRNLHKLH
jgi:hypothetical protein